jgi:hypothetical protein
MDICSIFIDTAAGGGGPPGPMVWSANTSGSDFTTVENRGIRSSGGSDVVSSGIWGPGIGGDTMLWRPSSGFNTTNIPDEITGAVFRIYMFEQFGASAVTAHENLRAWTSDVSWTTPASNGVWIEVTLDAATVEAWRQAGGAPSNGIQLRGDGQFSSYYSNQGTDGLRPELVLTFD